MDGAIDPNRTSQSNGGLPVTAQIAVDVMGGSGGVSTNVEGIAALDDVRGLILVGDRGLIVQQPQTGALLERGACIHDASEWLTGTESINEVLRHRPNTSMAVCARLVKTGKAAGMVTSGDTRALMALARLHLGTLSGLRRPAIIKAFSGDLGNFWMLDLGANVDCTATVLVQFAKLGKIIASLGEKSPPIRRVALLNIGTERGKGPKILNDAATMIQLQLPELSWVGFVEPSELFEGKADIVVCDGFVGNLVLKTLEGTATHLGRTIKRGLLGGSWLSKLGVTLARPDIEAIRDELDPQNYNGALLAGIRDGVVVKSHGSAGALGFSNAILQTRDYVDAQLITQLEAALDSR